MKILAIISPFILSRIIWQFYKDKINIYKIKKWESALFWPWLIYIKINRNIYCQIKPVDKSKKKEKS